MATETLNIESQIVVKTAAQWAIDTVVYSKHILVTSDVFYAGTDQRKFKIPNGVDTWSNLDYIPDAVSSVNGLTGAVLLTGTADRITVTGGVWDIASTYVGQASITTLGTITTGVWNGTALTSAYLPATLVYNNQANAYTAGMKQTFAADATNAGLRFSGVTANPSVLAGGDMWFRSDDGFMRYYDGTTVRTLVNLAGAQTLTNKTLTSPVITGPTVTIGSDATGDILYNGGSGVLARSANLNFNGSALLLGAPTATGRTLDLKQDTATVAIGSLIGTTSQPALYFNQTAPTAGNYNITGTATTTTINGATTGGSVILSVGNSNRITVNNTGITLTTGSSTSGSGTKILFTQASHTGQTAGAEVFSVLFDNSAILTHASNTLMSTQRTVVINAMTYAFATAGGVISRAATLAITGAPIAGTNCTITNAYALWVQAGVARFDGGISMPAGASTASVKVGGVLQDFVTDAGNSGTSETDIYSYTSPASILGVNGDKLDATYGGNFVSSATATRQLKFYFGGTVIFDSGALSISGSSSWTLFVTIIRVSASVIRYTIDLQTQGAALSSYCSTGELTGLTLSNTNVMKMTGTAAGVGAATNDIIARLGTIQWKSAA